MPKQKLTKRADGRFRCKLGDKYFYGHTKDEALKARERYKRQLQDGIKNVVVCYRDYAARWLAIYKAGVCDKCYNDYAQIIAKTSTVLGDKPISEINPSDIMQVYNLYINMSASTIHRVRMLLLSILDTAAEEGYCRTNPARSKSAKVPKGTTGTHRIITEEEKQLILQVHHRCQLGAMAMLYAGLRRGEMLAVDIDKDIDFERKCIRIHQAVRYDTNQPIISTPKTDAGTREVPLMDILANMLDGHHGLLMQSDRVQGYMSEAAFKNAWASYNRALSKAAGHPVSIRCHDLRHSYCTFLRDEGIDMHLAMKWMGHADEKMILRIYDHVTDERAEKAVKKLEKSLARGQSGGQIASEEPETLVTSKIRVL